MNHGLLMKLITLELTGPDGANLIRLEAILEAMIELSSCFKGTGLYNDSGTQ